MRRHPSVYLGRLTIWMSFVGQACPIYLGRPAAMICLHDWAYSAVCLSCTQRRAGGDDPAKTAADVVFPCAGGNISYLVRSDCRRRDCAGLMLDDCPRRATALGMSWVLITCTQSSLDSRRTVLSRAG